MSRIEISRSKYIEESRAIADLRLRDKSFLPGELVMLNYYKDPDFRSDIGVLIAIGIKEGTGEDCYRIVSAGGTVKVRNVVDELPDVSKLVHDELYIYRDPDKNWNYVYKVDEVPPRHVEKIGDGEFIFVDLESGYRWFYQSIDGEQECKREDDFFSKEKIKEILRIFDEIKLRAHISSVNGYLFKTGEVKDIILDLKAYDEVKEEYITGKCEFWIGDEQLIPDTDGRWVLKNIDRDTTVRVVVKYKIVPGIYITDYQDITIRFGYRFFFGRVDDNWTPTSENVEALENSIISFRRDWEYNKITFSNMKIAVAYPKKYGYLGHIYDTHKMDYIRSYQAYFPKDVIFDGEEYIVYIKKEPVTVTCLSQRFVFNKSDSLEINENSLLDLLNAWRDRNSPNGLVVLDENGKIDPELLYGAGSGTFPVIKEFVTEYPTEGMETGDVYFNTTNNTLFFAIDEVSGVISDPEPRTIYIIGGEFYSWVGHRFEKFSKIETRVITDIKEIYNVSNT